jgi:hypothetical protein
MVDNPLTDDDHEADGGAPRPQEHHGLGKPVQARGVQPRQGIEADDVAVAVRAHLWGVLQVLVSSSPDVAGEDEVRGGVGGAEQDAKEDEQAPAHAPCRKGWVGAHTIFYVRCTHTHTRGSNASKSNRVGQRHTNNAFI